MLAFALVPVLLGLSMLVQRPVARRLGVTGPLWPVVPMPATSPVRARVLVRGAGLAFTFTLVVLAAFAQLSRERDFTARVDVAPGLAADRAGVKSGDVVLAVDGRAVSSFVELREALVGAATLRLTLERDGVVLEREVLVDGLLGVKWGGETKARPTTDAVGLAIALPFVIPARLLKAWLGGGGSSSLWSWVLVPLVLSWWATFAVELLGLALSLGRRAPAEFSNSA